MSTCFPEALNGGHRKWFEQSDCMQSSLMMVPFRPLLELVTMMIAKTLSVIWLHHLMKSLLTPSASLCRACRHGDRCSRLHNRPTISPTLLLPNLYQNPALNAPPGPDGLPMPVDARKSQEHFEVSLCNSVIPSDDVAFRQHTVCQHRMPHPAVMCTAGICTASMTSLAVMLSHCESFPLLSAVPAVSRTSMRTSLRRWTSLER